MDSTGACRPCVYTIEQGCLVCEAWDPTKCMMCVPGYFMDKGRAERFG